MTVLRNDLPDVTVDEVTPEEGRELFKRACQRELGVTAEEFMAAHLAGEFPAEWSVQAIQRVEFLIPFAR